MKAISVMNNPAIAKVNAATFLPILLPLSQKAVDRVTGRAHRM